MFDCHEKLHNDLEVHVELKKGVIEQKCYNKKGLEKINNPRGVVIVCMLLCTYQCKPRGGGVRARGGDLTNFKIF